MTGAARHHLTGARELKVWTPHIVMLPRRTVGWSPSRFRILGVRETNGKARRQVAYHVLVCSSLSFLLFSLFLSLYLSLSLLLVFRFPLSPPFAQTPSICHPFLPYLPKTLLSISADFYIIAKRDLENTKRPIFQPFANLNIIGGVQRTKRLIFQPFVHGLLPLFLSENIRKLRKGGLTDFILGNGRNNYALPTMLVFVRASVWYMKGKRKYPKENQVVKKKYYVFV